MVDALQLPVNPMAEHSGWFLPVVKGAALVPGLFLNRSSGHTGANGDERDSDHGSPCQPFQKLFGGWRGGTAIAHDRDQGASSRAHQSDDGKDGGVVSRHQMFFRVCGGHQMGRRAKQARTVELSKWTPTLPSHSTLTPPRSCACRIARTDRKRQEGIGVALTSVRVHCSAKALWASHICFHQHLHRERVWEACGPSLGFHRIQQRGSLH
jgi:hypothetical protein